MAEEQNFLSKIKSKFSFKKKHIAISICIVILCVVVLAYSAKFTKPANQSTTSQTRYTFDALEYAGQVATNLQDVLNNMKGVSNAKVVVIVNQSPEVKYQTENKGDDTVVVYNKNGSSYEPAIVTQFLPKICGVLIVAKGTGDLTVKNNLLNAISAVYDVDISCIEILEGK